MPHIDGERTWYSCAETARLVRTALAREFPGVRFGVRSHVYAGGASIDVSAPAGGPDRRAVRAVVAPYAGAGFDGMIDMQYYRDAFIDEAGRVLGLDDPGTEGSRGSVPARRDPQPPGTRRVHFGANFVFVENGY
jgi:hypothetical protein